MTAPLASRSGHSSPFGKRNNTAKTMLADSTKEALQKRAVESFMGESDYTALVHASMPISDHEIPNFKKICLRYSTQKATAKQRGIEWCFTLESWLKVWLASGKFLQRGTGREGFCMSRRGDKGPYSAENVVIVTNSENIREYRTSDLPWSKHPGIAALGKGRGWTYLKSKKQQKNPYQVVVAMKYVGCFATPEAANAAYIAASAAHRERMLSQ